jgi:hypothetical protein
MLLTFLSTILYVLITMCLRRVGCPDPSLLAESKRFESIRSSLLYRACLALYPTLVGTVRFVDG